MKPYSYTLTIETKLGFATKTVLEPILSKIGSEFEVSFEFTGKYKLPNSEKHYIDVYLEEEIDILAFYSKFSTITELEEVFGISLNLASGSLSYKLAKESELAQAQKVAENRQKLELERKKIKEEKAIIKREKESIRREKHKEKQIKNHEKYLEKRKQKLTII